MLPIARQPEPENFDALVRQPGAQFLSGQNIVAGPVPKGFKWNPHWRKSIPDLYAAYQGICAFSGLRIARTTGASTVEHFLPKKIYPLQAYDWANFLLVSARLNSRKGDWLDVIDPFSMPEQCFHLNFTNGLLTVNSSLPKVTQDVAKSTIRRLHLNRDVDLIKDRLADFQDYIDDKIHISIFQRSNPFAYSEAVRQNLLRPEDRS
jgi:uncharacterized protein (TIGR02646 family)